jgi:hypothetical protein
MQQSLGRFSHCAQLKVALLWIKSQQLRAQARNLNINRPVPYCAALLFGCAFFADRVEQSSNETNF